MPIDRAANKSERLLQIEALLLAHPEGLSQSELARRLGVNRSTINRDLPELTSRFAVYETDDGQLCIDRDHYLADVRFTLHEALALHLAARLMATGTDKQNPHAAAALRKLGIALDKLAPLIAGHLKDSADVMDDAARYHDPVYLEVLETLTRAWSLGRKVELKHQIPGAPVMTYRFSTYFIEPYATGQTAHVIGWREPPGALRTFKVERIKTVRLLDEPYTIPESFSPQALLADAWGIWYTEAEPAPVLLKFHPRVAARVQETHWHRNATTAVQPDGYVLWKADIAEPREMLPWIRGWGGDCEVLAPEELRELLAKEARRLAKVYGVLSQPPTPTYQLLWAKLTRDKTRSHPLICHLLDVAAVTEMLWHNALTDGQHAAWCAVFGLDAGVLGRWLAFWSALHDLGKASPAFQRQWREAETLLGAALPFPQRFTNETCPHGLVTAVTLPEILSTDTGFSLRAAKLLARALGGHHGSWSSPLEEQQVKADARGGAEWDRARLELVQVLRETLQPLGPAPWPFARIADANAFLTWFSGLVSVSDWIGSMETYFPYVDAPVDLASYAQQSAAQAQTAFQSLNWPAWQPPAEPRAFSDLFDFKPSGMQQTAIALAERLTEPTLVLIEAPTGSGKTEAALYLADTWARVLQQRGLYVAMPTMATSNQMWERVGQFLQGRYAGAIEPLLIHAQARWATPPETPTLQEEGQATEEASAAALTWFLPRKKSLLVPCAVGTVDQALLSVLQARHFFVRLFGLSDKTVIFDEIHAYDTYMSTLFQRLLAWLRSLRASVVLLSATLPTQTRQDLLEAYAGRHLELPLAEYPAISWVTAAGACGVEPLPKPEDTSVAVQWLRRDPAVIVDALRGALSAGGCAAVICNTVARAQELYTAIKDAQLVPEADLTLFHARFPFGWRDATEKQVLERFGKRATRENGARPERAIVVATQVIEQSLDLDFDVLISDLAPVDLLVQRAGRLHRHPGRQRPAGVAAPQILLAVDVEGDAEPKWHTDTFVYTRYLLLRTYLALRGRQTLSLPGDGAQLIEMVYGAVPLPELPSALLEALASAKTAMEVEDGKDEYEARKRLVGKPAFDDLLTGTPAGLAEDAPDIHTAFQALTRLGPPSISLVCLHRTSTDLNTEPDGSGVTIELQRYPDAITTEAIVRVTVSVNRREVVTHFQAQTNARPSVWRKHPLLRDHYIAEFDSAGRCSLNERLALRLSREKGLEIEK